MYGQASIHVETEIDKKKKREKKETIVIECPKLK